MGGGGGCGERGFWIVFKSSRGTVVMSGALSRGTRGCVFGEEEITCSHEVEIMFVGQGR